MASTTKHMFLPRMGSSRPGIVIGGGPNGLHQRFCGCAFLMFAACVGRSCHANGHCYQYDQFGVTSCSDQIKGGGKRVLDLRSDYFTIEW